MTESYFPPMDYSAIENPGEAIGEVGSALELFQQVYASPRLPLSTRMRAAAQAVPFEAPKLSMVANVNGNDLGNRLMAARKRLADRGTPLHTTPLLLTDQSRDSNRS